jgi:hypothetical protein
MKIRIFNISKEGPGGSVSFGLGKIIFFDLWPSLLMPRCQCAKIFEFSSLIFQFALVPFWHLSSEPCVVFQLHDFLAASTKLLFKFGLI